MREWDVRITPSDQEPVQFEFQDEDFEVLVACREGGTPELRLHYHLYVKSNRSETYLDKVFNKWGRATATAKGNAIFSKRKAHEGTIGYCVKGGDVIVRHGWDDTFLEEMLARSQDYKKTLETTRKRALRQKENYLADILKEVAVQLDQADSPTPPTQVMALILSHYDKLHLRFPNRNVLETAVMTLLYKKQPNLVIGWYSRNIVENNFY